MALKLKRMVSVRRMKRYMLIFKSYITGVYWASSVVNLMLIGVFLIATFGLFIWWLVSSKEMSLLFIMEWLVLAIVVGWQIAYFYLIMQI